MCKAVLLDGHERTIRSGTIQYVYEAKYLIIVTCGFIIIREYGSALYVGMARKKTNGHQYILIVIVKLKSLLIYTDRIVYIAREKAKYKEAILM